jgi:hypothetical protein
LIVSIEVHGGPRTKNSRVDDPGIVSAPRR